MSEEQKALDKSLSARRAWIEISIDDLEPSSTRVALRKESVDRNSVQPRKTEVPGVALRKESVDRNVAYSRLFVWIAKSLSARRAWIEIFYV